MNLLDSDNEDDDIAKYSFYEKEDLKTSKFNSFYLFGAKISFSS